MNATVDDEDFDRFLSAEEALRDVLFMYKTLTNYGGLYDDFFTEDGQFDPFIFIDCSCEKFSISPSEQVLLQQASAIKLICIVYRAWGQSNYPQEESELVNDINALLSNGRIDHLHIFRKTLELAIKDIGVASKNFDFIYQTFVVGYFQSLGKRNLS
jgi:hypothetical protein